MATFDDHGRPEPDPVADELTTLLGFLDFQRATFAWKCAGLDRRALDRCTASSTMTLGGMLKHLAYVEDSWCSRSLFGNEPAPPFDTVDWRADPDWDWHSASADAPEQLRQLWEDSVLRSRAHVAAAIEQGGLGLLATRPWSDGRRPSLRWILMHLVEEYSRHNGHADMLRESIDGATGE